MPALVAALANDKFRATLRTTYIASPADTTLSVTAIPTNLPTIVTVGWNTIYETVFRITGTSGTNSSNYALTGVTKIKGYSGNLAQNLAVNCLNNEDYFNQYKDVIVTQVGLKTLLYAADGGSTDTYAISLTVVPGAYSDLLGIPLSVKVNTANTGAATLNVNGLGAITIKKFKDKDLTTGDLIAGQIITLIYDGTNFQLQSKASNTRSIITAASYTTDTGTSLNCDTLANGGWFIVTAQTGALKLNNPTGTPVDGQMFGVAITGTAARALTYDTQFEASTQVLPSTTVTTARLNMCFVWRADTSKWVIVASI